MKTEKDIALLKASIDQLNQQAWEVRVTDSNRSLVLSNEALNLATTIDYTKGKAEGLRTKGFCHLRLSKNKEAQALLEESLQLYKALNDAAGIGYIYTGLGIIQRNMGDYKASLEFLNQSSELITQTNYREVEPLVYYHMGITYKYMGNLEQALEFILKSLAVGKEVNNWIAEAYTLNTLGSIYDELGDYDHALEHHHQSLVIRREAGDKWGEAGSLDSIGSIHLKQGNYPKALSFCGQSLAMARSVGDKKGEANSLFHLAQIYNAQSEPDLAWDNARQSLIIREEIGDKKGQAEIYVCLAAMKLPKKNQNEIDSEQMNFLKKALALGEETGALDLLFRIHQSFYKLFKQQHQFEDALQQLELSDALEKEIHSQSFKQKILNLEIAHKIEQSKKEAEIYRLRNVELAHLYEESTKQKNEIQATYTELKATQVQLIQSEKMASLGELTAGIAHEIQNPLNFVNNFSEVSNELLVEMNEELDKGDIEEAKAIANDVKHNLEKINHHGKRADAIVKGMLQHSRSSSGQKEPTDINALADEYLRLSYHGLRAKDKSFNAKFETDFDANVGSVIIIPQDLGRVILNLINNAFYAVTEKRKQQIDGYEPTVTVSTKKLDGKVLIVVKDNGSGIPQKVLEKIFQPFFTTKPAGKGTGLGLSLSYDIVTKGHGGTLRVDTREGEGTSFIIEIPA